MKCIEKLKKYCVENGIVSENKAEWFQYGVERRLTTLVVGVPFYILALALTNVSTSVAFFLSFYFLRCRINGFHAKSVLACLFISLLCEIFFLTIVYYLLTPIVMVSINLVGILLVFWLAPFTDSSFPLTSKEFHSVKRSGKSRILALTIIMCISMAFGKYEFAKGVTTGIAMAVFLLSLAYIIQGGKKHEQATGKC